MCPAGEPNLRAEMAACGVDARQRLLFAPVTGEIGPHLRRIAHAQLVVDTLEYNCHTTGSDALWSGVPMLSTAGEPMAARVGASLLTSSSGLAGVVHGLREYADVADRLLAPIISK